MGALILPNYRGPFSSEIVFVPGDPLTEDCVAASGLDIAAAAGIGNLVNRFEREALRVDSGDTSGGMTLEALARGLQKRYGHRPHSSTTWQYVVDHPERWFVCIGQYVTLSAHLRRWQPNGSFLHATAFGPGDHAGRWWANPLAPPTYMGEEVGLGQIKRYMATFGFQALSFEAHEFATTGGGNVDVSLTWNPTNPTTGTITLKGAGHSLISPGGYPDITGRPDGQVLPCYGTNRLSEPFNPGAGDRQNVYETSSGGKAYFVIFADATFTPNPVPPAADCAVEVAAAIKADRAKARVAVVYE